MPYLGDLPGPKPDHFNDWPNDAGFTAAKEQPEPVKAKVSGKFAPYTSGSLFRTGPGTYKVSTDSGNEYARSHWFDGFTYIHKFEIAAGDSGSNEVLYSSRCQVDEMLEKARSTGKLEGFTFGQKRDPCDSFFKKLKTSFQSTNVKLSGPRFENVGVVVTKTPTKPSSISLTSTSDYTALKQFDPNTLEPLGVTDQTSLNPELIGPLSSAHPAVDPLTGDLFNYNLEFGPKITYRIFKINMRTGKTEILAKVSDKEIGAAYIHSLFLTENTVILCVWPALFKKNGLSLLWEQNVIDGLHFDPSVRSNWIVVDRKHGRGVLHRYTSDPMFAFHSVNAFEQRNEQGGIDIICDLVEYSNMDILSKFYYENLISNSAGAKRFTQSANPSLRPYLKRYCLASAATEPQPTAVAPLRNPQQATVLRSIAGPNCGDLPRINERSLTKMHKYVYSVGFRDCSSFYDCIVKTDMEASDPASSSLMWQHPKHSPGEPVFIPDPTGTTEDDGVILSVVLGEQGTSYLLCLDARSMTEIARAEVDVAIGFGFHGLHLPRD